MFDITEVEKEARKKMNEELAKSAKGKIKDKLRQIASAEKVLLNLRAEYTVLLADIGSEVVG